ncbi:MAG TPA: hypothetical protein VMU00_03520 [Steroidobacteraceae bacterium]|nr:hypothetical protein [Steroidobacteraceae bacterium]
MTTADARPGPPRNLPRSVAAILAGTLVVIVLSVGTDELLHLAHVYPGWGYPMPEPALNLLALSYRLAFNAAGAYVTARLAPRNPVRHLWVFAAIGFGLGTLGAVATLPMHLGPAWYPIALALSAWPCTWLGWRLVRRGSAGRA